MDVDSHDQAHNLMAADVLAVHYLGAGRGFCCCFLFFVVVFFFFLGGGGVWGGGGRQEQPSWLPRGSAQFMVVSTCPICTASHFIIMEQFHCWSDIPHPTSSFHISLSTTAFFYTPEIPVSDSTPDGLTYLILPHPFTFHCLPLPFSTLQRYPSLTVHLMVWHTSSYLILSHFIVYHCLFLHSRDTHLWQYTWWSDIPHPTSSFHISLSTTAFFYTPKIPVSDSTPDGLTYLILPHPFTFHCLPLPFSTLQRYPSLTVHLPPPRDQWCDVLHLASASNASSSSTLQIWVSHEMPTTCNGRFGHLSICSVISLTSACPGK